MLRMPRRKLPAGLFRRPLRSSLPQFSRSLRHRPVRLLVAAPAGLNLREGPHKSYAVLAVLPEGSVVTALDLPEDAEVPRWALVSSEAGTGWVADEFLLPEV